MDDGADSQAASASSGLSPGLDRARLGLSDLAIPELTVPKASDVLAAHLRKQILDGVLEAGVLLPVERVLAASAGLSRGTVREALRILQIEGLIEIRPGRAGGSIVRRPDLHSVGRSLDVFIRGRRIRLSTLLEVRDAIEPSAAALAAANHSDDDMETLRAESERLESAGDDVAEFLRRNLSWHLAIVRASGNELMFAFMSGLSDAIYAGTAFEELNSKDRRALTVAAHRKVLRAISDRDEDAAFRTMRAHVHAYHAAVDMAAHPEDLDLERVPDPSLAAGPTAL